MLQKRVPRFVCRSPGHGVAAVLEHGRSSANQQETVLAGLKGLRDKLLGTKKDKFIKDMTESTAIQQFLVLARPDAMQEYKLMHQRDDVRVQLPRYTLMLAC